jgi:hypothetical protein
MNTTNCPPYLATDEILSIQWTPESCDMSVIAYLTLMILLLSVRCMGWLTSVRYWRKRQAIMLKAAGDQRMKAQRRLPIVPAVSAVMQILWMTFLILTATDVGNNQNGIPAAFWGTLIMLWGFSAVSMVRRLISLGAKLIPLSGIRIDKDSTQFSKSLKRLDLILQLCFIAMPILLIIEFILCAIVIPVSSTTAQFTIADSALTGGFVVSAMFCALLGGSLTWQLNRLVGATKLLSSVGVAGHGNEQASRSIQKAIMSMRYQQMMWISTGTASSFIFAALAGKLIPAKWYAWVILNAIETACFTFVACSQRGVGSRNRKDDGGGAGGGYHHHHSPRKGGKVATTNKILQLQQQQNSGNNNHTTTFQQKKHARKSLADVIGIIANGDGDEEITTSGNNNNEDGTVNTGEEGSVSENNYSYTKNNIVTVTGGQSSFDDGNNVV